MSKKRLTSAITHTVLFFACIHILILAYLALTTQNFTYLNAFSILDLQEFFPGIEAGMVSSIISFIVIAAIFLLYYSRAKKK